MNRRHTSWVLVGVLLLIYTPAAMAKSNLPAANKRAAIKTYVRDAAKVVAKNGPSCDTFKSADWMGGDYYVFVTGPRREAGLSPQPLDCRKGERRHRRCKRHESRDDAH